MTDLARAAGVGIMTLNRFEGGQTVQPRSVDRIVTALVAAGIVLIDQGDASPDGGEGVRLSFSPPIRT